MSGQRFVSRPKSTSAANAYGGMGIQLLLHYIVTAIVIRNDVVWIEHNRRDRLFTLEGERVGRLRQPRLHRQLHSRVAAVLKVDLDGVRQYQLSEVGNRDGDTL